MTRYVMNWASTCGVAVSNPTTFQGPIVVNLAPPARNNGSWSACRSAGPDLNWEIVEEIVANPGGFYVNVDNSVYAPGAVRGQLGQ